MARWGPRPDLPTPYIPECYSHQYIRQLNTKGVDKYSSVSYWKLYNGGTAWDCLGMNESFKGLYSPIGRMVWQVAGTLKYMLEAGECPMFHCDLHLCNIFVDFGRDTNLPDFYVGDFGRAKM
ncbi:hypothetical protein B0T26DRAFT_645654, partial [Lasiosphaeria miniovina]